MPLISKVSLTALMIRNVIMKSPDMATRLTLEAFNLQMTNRVRALPSEVFFLSLSHQSNAMGCKALGHTFLIRGPKAFLDIPSVFVTQVL